MGMFQLDTTIKTAIELGLEDMRKNLWLIDHMLEDMVKNPYLKDKYGQKQIDACKEWFANNQIDIYMRNRDDKDRFPCITITTGTDNEKDDMKSMADQSAETVILMPGQIGKPIPYIVKPFVPTGYDQASGIIGIPPNVDAAGMIAAGMILVNPANGEGFVIVDATDIAILVAPGTVLNAATLAVVPKYQFYEARIEHTFCQLAITIGCHVHGDTQTLLWLHSIVKYAILRYREGLLEAQGFSQTNLSSGDMLEDPNFQGAGGEKAFLRKILLTGQIEESWIKSPRRFIETIALKEQLGNGYVGGIKILSNADTPDFIDKNKETWYTDAENEIDPLDPEDQGEGS